jgi:Thymidylate kinase
MECEYALRSGIPLISVARMDVEVSRMLQGHPAVNDLIRYSDDEDLRHVLLKRLGNLHKPPRRPGLFIAFEGMDGTGKSTLAKACWERYSKRFEGRLVTLISDPPSLPPWDKVREIFSEANALTAQSEAILLLAARVDQANRAVVPVLQPRRASLRGSLSR